ncbi:trypsin-like isoform X2 [Bacillus rossius redtenbacheri]|uniref:trypsin-like isoform X2 n=1 Tax=Bacillus rossius redtenbacheri TaxID=93214 RepID=UPI002FDE876C
MIFLPWVALLAALRLPSPAGCVPADLEADDYDESSTSYDDERPEATTTTTTTTSSRDEADREFHPGQLRIIGGEEAEDSQFPYIVSLRWQGSHFCGGSVISARHVLTAAHCMDAVDPSEVYVVMGTTSLANIVYLATIEKSKIHEHYDNSNFQNDIALLKLSANVTLDGKRIASVQMRTDSAELGENCVVSGWGVPDQVSNSVSPELRYVEVPVTSCGLYSAMILPGMVCAGFREGGKDACQGDSGGPLVCGGLLTGVVSWGYGCAEENYPGVYTEVAHFRDWIADAIAEFDSSMAGHLSAASLFTSLLCLSAVLA